LRFEGGLERLYLAGQLFDTLFLSGGKLFHIPLVYQAFYTSDNQSLVIL
jgi:hypothetical protein